ncbi:Hypothetical protein R9X50_00767100 [Acrodontium crateriforme]|uniref:Cyclochlorotine biosynthesis protein O n=1 Tax=Acrodontium crateriforme TaxID=150365 RepID=A0AAQ3R7X8_9PEZI|nr:Hypothetical protein R9X50_00767100 [Acrodontium crateriforme]
MASNRKDIKYRAVENDSTQPAKHRGGLGFKIVSHLTFFLLGIVTYHFSNTATCLPTRSAPLLSPNLISIIPDALLEHNKIVRINGSLAFPSIYRGRGPEVDQAWLDLVQVGLLNLHVSTEQALKMGIDQNKIVRWPPASGGGYLLSLETFHQLHCVNLLRKTSYWNFDYYHARAEVEQDFQHLDQLPTHVDHCLEMVRQHLMCTADPTLISHHDVPEHELPWPDYSTVHHCRDFERIQAWARSIEIK